MSEYLRVLTRHERETRRVSAAVRASHKPGAPALIAITDDRVRTVLAPVSDSRAAGFAALYDNLRATANGDAIRSLVVAGAGPADSPRVVVDGLAAHVRRLGQRVCVAEVVDAGELPLLRVRTGPGDTGRGAQSARALDLRSPASAEDVRAWLAAIAGGDLTLIDAGSLSASIDPALLACGSDGLVIALDADTTTRDALRVAAERARAVGCRILGLVVAIQQQNLPPWERRQR
jgi:hypothetical protein